MRNGLRERDADQILASQESLLPDVPQFGARGELDRRQSEAIGKGELAEPSQRRRQRDRPQRQARDEGSISDGG